jgi:hypothetical protein
MSFIFLDQVELFFMLLYLMSLVLQKLINELSKKYLAWQNLKSLISLLVLHNDCCIMSFEFLMNFLNLCFILWLFHMGIVLRFPILLLSMSIYSFVLFTPIFASSSAQNSCVCFYLSQFYLYILKFN